MIPTTRAATRRIKLGIVIPFSNAEYTLKHCTGFSESRSKKAMGDAL
jgi:hypothetical protein